MLNDVLNAIKEAKNILLAAHVHPDGDAMGALVGMAYLCEYYQIPYCILAENIPEEYNYLIKELTIKSEYKSEYDTFISLDCGDPQRLGDYEIYFKRANTTINIDHHETNNSFGNYNYVEKEASSTSELIFNLIEEAKMPLTLSVAEAIYTGLVTDTGGFMHSCTQPSTHRVAAKLLEVPFDFSTLYYTLIHQKSEKTIVLQCIAIEHMMKLCQGKVYLSYLTQEDFDNKKATREDASSIVTYLKNIKGCEIAILLYPDKEGTYKMSLRSSAPYNVAEIATHFGGGGHIRAAGATIKGELIPIIEDIKNYLSF